MSNQVTIADVRRAFTAHVDALAKCGITYDGRLILSEGSKYFGSAYRINLTDFPHPCQNRQWDEQSASYAKIVWDHAGCRDCNGTKIETCTGHNRPPIGDDFLGMTKREAYDELTSRTRAVCDTAAAIADEPTTFTCHAPEASG